VSGPKPGRDRVVLFVIAAWTVLCLAAYAFTFSQQFRDWVL
jgi:hypothetical protein